MIKINPSRIYNNCKYICTQHRSTSIHKVTAAIKEEIDSNTIIVGDFNTSLTPKDTDWLNGYKNKTCIYAVYKRPTSDLGTHTD